MQETRNRSGKGRVASAQQHPGGTELGLAGDWATALGFDAREAAAWIADLGSRGLDGEAEARALVAGIATPAARALGWWGSESGERQGQGGGGYRGGGYN